MLAKLSAGLAGGAGVGMIVMYNDSPPHHHVHPNQKTEGKTRGCYAFSRSVSGPKKLYGLGFFLGQPSSRIRDNIISAVTEKNGAQQYREILRFL